MYRRLFLLGLLLLTGAAGLTARPAASQRGLIAGRLRTVWRCGGPEAPHCRPGYALEDALGNCVPVLDERGLLPPVALDGRIAVADGTARGAWSLGRGRRALRAEALRLQGGGEVRTHGATGALPYITVLCRFGDSPGLTPHDLAYYQGLMGDQYPGIGHWYHETSNGAMSMTGSRVVGWYNLPRPRSEYSPGDDDFDWELALQDAVAAADADVDFRQYAGINLVFNDNPFTTLWGIGMIRTVTADGETRRRGVTWIRQGNNQTLLAHEIGHSLGLLHSGGQYDNVYDSEWDVMSYWHGTLHPVYGWVAPGTIGYHKQQLGWIPEERAYTALPGTSRALRLERLQQPSASGDYLVANVPINGSPGRFFTVEARRKNGYDAGLPGEGVLIHHVDLSRDDGVAQVVDADGNGNPNDAGATWLPGETFIDAASKTTVEVVSDTGSGYVVNVAVGWLPPSSLTAKVSAGGIALAWRDNTTMETGFQVERRSENGGFSSVATVAGNTTRYTDAAAAPGTTYTYRVRAVGSGAGSPYSNEAGARAQAVAPGRLKVSPTRVNFGRIALGASRTRTFRVSNIGAGPLAFTVGAPAAPFELVSGGEAGSLAPRASRTVTLRFQPGAAGTFTGRLTVTGGGASLQVSLSGRAR